MDLSVVSDELSEDFQTAVEIAYSWGLCKFEIRNAWLARVPNIPATGIEIIKSVIKKYNIIITALSPGIFKIPLHSEEMVYHKVEILLKTFDLARELDTESVTIFGVHRSPSDSSEDYQEFLNNIGGAVELAEKEGIVLMLENEAGCWADTGNNTARIVREIGNPALRINWDPGNAFTAGEIPYPDGYAAVRGRVANVHIKMAARDSERKIHYLEGSGGYLDLKGQIGALKVDNYEDYIALETHHEPRVEESRRCLEIVRKAIRDCNGI